MECRRRTTFINIQMRRSGLCLRGNGGSVAVQESGKVHQQFREIAADDPLLRAFKLLAESLSEINRPGVFDNIPSCRSFQSAQNWKYAECSRGRERLLLSCPSRPC